MLVSSFVGLGGVLTVNQTTVQAASSYGLMDSCQEGVILHAWEWSFNNIKANMQQIAEAGYTSVQTSVIQRAKEGTKGKTNEVWWVYYQPAEFCIDDTGNSALGTKAEFAAMCEEAHKYGIRVIVDVVANHLGNQTKYDLSSSIPDDIRNDSNCWHSMGFEEIGDYENRNRVINGSMGGLPDLNTENPKIQNYVKSYLRECIDCGADGFRFDAAKHIGVPSDGSDFWPNVIGDATGYYQTKGKYGSLYCYGEILDGTAGPAISEYTQYMSITDNRTGNGIRSDVEKGNAAGAARSSYDKGAAPTKTVLWAESHDTYSNDGKESTGVSDSNINKTWALVASRNGATALYFARTAGWRGGKIGDICSTQCFNKEVVEVNKFHNAFSGQSEYLSSSGSIAYVERGTKGVVLVNCSGGSQQVSVAAHKMTDGTYTDQVTGNTFTVSGGQISGQIGNTGIAVVYDGVASTRVSANPGSTSFTDTLSVTLNVSGAASGSYSTSEGASGSYTNGQVITIGAGTAVGSSVTLTLSATGEDGNTVSETYTYLKKDPNAVTKIYFDNSSYNWSSVYAYIYNDSSNGGGNNGGSNGGGNNGGNNGGNESSGTDMLFTDTLGWGTVYAYFFNGSGDCGPKWPGAQMSLNGQNDYGQNQFKIAIPTGATHVVFNNNAGSQTGNLPVAGVTGYYLDGSPDNAKPFPTMAKASATATTAVENAAWPGVAMTLNTSTNLYEYVVPDNLVNGKVVFSDKGSATNRYPANMQPGLAINDTSMKFGANNTWEVYQGSDPVPPPPPVTDPTVICDKPSGTSFTTETFTINLSLANAVKGTYSVDNGPVKEFTSATDVVIGEGKIGDSTVKVDTTAVGSDGTTKTYSFSFEKKYVKKTTSSSAGTLSSYYATNAKGKGAAKTITVDGDISDWDSSMLIAQGTANDDPRVYRPDSMYEVPKDLYALYAAYDDTNLYLMWEMTNVQDCVSTDDYPLTQGTMYLNENIPFFIALETGNSSTAIGNNGKTAAGGTLWDSGITFENSFNKIIAVSTNGANGPYVYGGTSAGLNAVEEYNAKTSGIVFKYGMGIVSTSVHGIDGGYGVNNNRVPGDMCSEGSAWVDFNTKGHKSAGISDLYGVEIIAKGAEITAEKLREIEYLNVNSNKWTADKNTNNNRYAAP